MFVVKKIIQASGVSFDKLTRMSWKQREATQICLWEPEDFFYRTSLWSWVWKDKEKCTRQVRRTKAYYANKQPG